MSSETSGDTVAAEAGTACTARPSPAATRTSRTSASSAPATLVTVPVSRSPSVCDRRKLAVRCGGPGHEQGGGPLPRGQLGEQVGAGVEQQGGRDDGAGQERDRCHHSAQLLQHHRGFAGRRAVTAARLGHEQPGQAELGGERLPESVDERAVAVVHRGHRGRVAASAQQVANAGAEVVLDVGVEQVHVAHRGISFHGTSLSTRCSPGSPSTRSATMLRRISEVPPSMELPFARR